MRNIIEIKQALDSFDRQERDAAVRELVEAREAGEWTPNPVNDWMNLHGHTFHSYNSQGWSPSRLVVEAVEAGLEIVGSVDFDVLDAMDEVFSASDLLGIKGVVGLESRVFIPEYADRELNSPGEPGIAYFMATGCFRLPPEGGPGEEVLRTLKELAQNRNREMVKRINAYLGEVRLDYESEVIPKTPSGNPTERHLVEAYNKKAKQVFTDNPSGLIAFWSDRFGMSPEDLAPVLAETNPFQELLRSKLMKKGGVGYAEPDPKSFPTLEDMIQLAEEMHALPTYAFLDGTTAGESNMRDLLGFLSKKGVCALNIIPDRNWNLTDPDTKKKKVGKLYEAVEAARSLSFPICVGTEMNKAGLPFVDNFGAEELEPVVDDFRRGGRALWGHTIFSRFGDRGWMSDFAQEKFGDSLQDRLEFYEAAGERLAPGEKTVESLKTLDEFVSSLER
ncbi:MAG: hypothetical protein KC944_13140 [Candidatus Omnitrophica bacterium]|nr:hypothetical protein [Candidatus Omnitrophota bacterium]